MSINYIMASVIIRAMALTREHPQITEVLLPYTLSSIYISAETGRQPCPSHFQLTYKWLDYLPTKNIDLGSRLYTDWGGLKVRSFDIPAEQTYSSSVFIPLMVFSIPVINVLSTISKESKIYTSDTHRREKPEILSPLLSISLAQYVSYKEIHWIWSKGKKI